MFFIMFTKAREISDFQYVQVRPYNHDNITCTSVADTALREQLSQSVIINTMLRARKFGTWMQTHVDDILLFEGGDARNEILTD